MKAKLLLAALAAFAPIVCLGEGSLEPSCTCLFAEKDGQELYLDIYDPAQGSETRTDGIDKPTILFVFGGGFYTGRRDEDSYKAWYSRLCEEGYRVVAIDYRLGMKGYKGRGISKAFIETMEKSIRMAVEDLFSATLFIIDNKDELGIDPYNIVISGSSAGAITSLQAEWEICNSTSLASMLPEGFNYAGVISFSGGLYNRLGGAVYASEPCPTMLLHGTADKTVEYSKIRVGKIYFGGSKSIAEAYRKAGYNYCIYRFEGNRHEIAASFSRNLDEELRFIETNVMKGEKRIVDATVCDPGIELWEAGDYNDLYD